MSAPSRTTLAVVLAAHGTQCGCEGACGKEHASQRCAAGTGQPVPLHAAPHRPRATETANAATPLSELRPWCGPCWTRALKRDRERAAEQRRVELDHAQLAIFDPSVLTAG
ncbi:hypothetical protein ACFY8C_38425 [Streptomyces flavochromogenes]|uniref:Secreted protein n=1 Tax=Streptomyces flavochromogenes TaxID=68199 RepID=A0ABW6Y335_9ACTN